MVDTKRPSLNDWIDRILAFLVAAVFVWFGNKLDKLTDKVGVLGETLSAVVARTGTTNEEVVRLRNNFEAHEKDYGRHHK